MDQSIKQQEHTSHAIIGLCMMVLSTSIFHIYRTSQFWNPTPTTPPTTTTTTTPTPGASSRPPQDVVIFISIFIFTILIAFWIAGLNVWIEHLGFVSIIQRNNSLIGGIAAANLGIAWTRLTNAPGTGIMDYVSNTLWPVYAGMIIGVLV